jgi:hypothetical protein
MILPLVTPPGLCGVEEGPCISGAKEQVHGLNAQRSCSGTFVPISLRGIQKYAKRESAVDVSFSRFLNAIKVSGCGRQ